MLDPSILVGPGTHHGPLSPVVADAPREASLVREAESRAQLLAATIELLSALDQAGNLDEAAHQAARSVCELVAAGRVLVLWRKANSRGLTVIAASDDRLDVENAIERRLVTAAGEEVAARGEQTRWPAVDAVGRHSLMAVAQLAESCSVESIIGIRLADSSGRDRGVLLAMDATNVDSAACLHAIEMPLASKLMGIERLQPTPLQSLVRGSVELVRGSRRNVILGLAIALGLGMLIPARYKVAAELELQPVKHRFVAVPFDGPLQTAHVRPGDMVERGELLATINPREIEYELAGIRAELSRSLQEKKGLMAEHDFAASKIASLESDRLRLQSDLLQYRRDNLEIRSPIAGVVVSGDLKQSEGMPMTRGETLFEIAPLGQMVVEIAVPEGDVAHVREGMDAQFYVNALPSRTMRGRIARLHPRSELRNHDNVYIAEIQILDEENLLRPGMRGRAKIVGDRHALGWNVFHKAYYGLRRAAGW